ncbi:hypothetical protein A2U01_0107071, partial [Trifolium medium]|nr:hypothetical protein [Trifolium medium]
FVDLFDQFGVVGMRLRLRARYRDSSGRGCSSFKVRFADFALHMRVWLVAAVGE